MRIENWSDELYAYIEASKDLKFEWGQNDCSLWAARWVDKITGSSIFDDWGGFYDDASSADDLMLDLGFVSCEEVANSYATQKHIKQAGRGDIVLYSSGALGICNGRNSYFLTHDKGLVAVPTLTCKKAWSI